MDAPVDAPTVFLTFETLRTLAGQVLVVVMLTQAVKSIAPTASTFLLRSTAVVSGIAVHIVLVWSAGMPLSAYVLAFANGTLVAVTAMKTAELLKGAQRASDA